MTTGDDDINEARAKVIEEQHQETNETFNEIMESKMNEDDDK